MFDDREEKPTSTTYLRPAGIIFQNYHKTSNISLT